MVKMVVEILNQSAPQVDIPDAFMDKDCDEFEIVTSRLIQTVRLTNADVEGGLEDQGTSLNTNLEIYSEKPKLIACERTSGEKFCSSLHYLENHNTILQISTDPEIKENISFSFYNTKQPYVRTQRVSIAREHYECAMVGNDRRREEDKSDNTLLVAMFSPEDSLDACKLLQFTRGVFANSSWEETPITKQLQNPSRYPSKMLTCFLISGTPSKPSPSKNEPIEHDSAVSIDNSPSKIPGEVEPTSKICVVFDETITFLDEALNVLKNMEHTDIDDDINWMNCFVSDNTINHNNNYIMACEASPDASKYKSAYTGGNSLENTTFVARCTMNSDDLTIELGTNDNAMLLKKELVTSVLEFAPNKLVMCINDKDLLIANNWQVAQIIKDPRIGNGLK